MTPLRKRMIEALELRGSSPKTMHLYVTAWPVLPATSARARSSSAPRSCASTCCIWFRRRKVAWGTYKQALAALRFLYRWVLQRGEVVQDIRAPRPERRLPVVLSFEEVHRFFAAIASFKHRMLLMFAYAAGLRISEAANVQVTDIDSQRMVIRVVPGQAEEGPLHDPVAAAACRCCATTGGPRGRRITCFPAAARPASSIQLRAAACIEDAPRPG